MNLHETITSIHIYMSTHKHIKRHMYKYISTNILTRLPILTSFKISQINVVDATWIFWFGATVCVVWCGVMWCCVVWCGVVFGVAWYGVGWGGGVWWGAVWCGMVWCGVV